MKKNILILYTSYGTGHYMAAKAIEEKYKLLYPNCKTLVLDPLKYSSPFLNKIFAEIGTLASTKFRKLRGNFYAKKMYRDYLSENKFYTFAAKLFWTKKLEKKLLEFNPDIIYSTQAASAKLIADHKHLFKAKLISVLTDYEIHRAYTIPHDNIDYYCVPSNSIKDKMGKIGIDKNKIFMSGMPIRNQFYNNKFSRAETIKKYYLDSKKPIILFVCGGGLGNQRSFNYFEMLLKSSLDFNYILVPGSNKRVEEKAKGITLKYNKKGKILGYSNNMAELINVSDLVIGKPGGILISECLELNKPFCSIEPIPGQETWNSIFLQKNSYGFNIKNLNSFKLFLNKVNVSIDLEEYKENIKEKHIKNSFEQFIKNLEENDIDL